MEAAWRLLLLHVLQSAVYLAAVYVYWGELGWWQHLFSTVVAMRELLYLIGAAGVAVLQPSFLLVDIVASWKEEFGWPSGPPGVVLYVLAPEKMIYWALASLPHTKGKCWGSTLRALGLVGTLLTDLCAIGALAAALHSGLTPPALVVSYGMTVLASVAMVHLIDRRGAWPHLWRLCDAPIGVRVVMLLVGMIAVYAQMTPAPDDAALSPSVASTAVAPTASLLGMTRLTWAQVVVLQTWQGGWVRSGLGVRVRVRVRSGGVSSSWRDRWSMACVRSGARCVRFSVGELCDSSWK